MNPLTVEITAVIRAALAEDIGTGDVTSESIFPDTARVVGTFRVKGNGILAGLDVAGQTFTMLDPDITFKASVSDGAAVAPGQTVATIHGTARTVLSGERVALNFLQRMSGIATLTHRFVEAVAGTECEILDTRKTAPGLRAVDKMAVRLGGGKNHRYGLFDMVLIKDNHIDAAGSMTAAVASVRSGPHAALPIEVECRTPEDVREALSLGVERLMLDNMELAMIREAVRMSGGKTPLEVSGNVSLSNVRSYAETGVQFISVGALTHSVQALDISMKVARVAG